MDMMRIKMRRILNWDKNIIANIKNSNNFYHKKKVFAIAIIIIFVHRLDNKCNKTYLEYLKTVYLLHLLIYKQR